MFNGTDFLYYIYIFIAKIRASERTRKLASLATNVTALSERTRVLHRQFYIIVPFIEQDTFARCAFIYICIAEYHIGQEIFRTLNFTGHHIYGVKYI